MPRGRVISETSSGGAIGTVAPWTEILAVYWDLETSGMLVGVGSDDRNDNGLTDPMESRTAGATGWPTTALQTPTDYSGIYATWNLDLRQDLGSWPQRSLGLRHGESISGPVGGPERGWIFDLAGVRLPTSARLGADRGGAGGPGANDPDLDRCG